MASEKESLNLLACREFLRSFSLSNTETNVEKNFCCGHAHHNSLIYQWVVVKDAPEMAQVLDAERQSMDQIIEDGQAHRGNWLLSHK